MDFKFNCFEINEIISFGTSFLLLGNLASYWKNLNNIARKMSNLDFSVKCNVTSDDEIGSLAMTLNFLSANLKRRINWKYKIVKNIRTNWNFYIFNVLVTERCIIFIRIDKLKWKQKVGVPEIFERRRNNQCISI